MLSLKQAVVFSEIFAISAMGLALSGCDQKPENVEISIPTVSIRTPSENMLTRALYAETLQLDPHFVQSAAEAAPVRDLFVGLTAFDEKGKTVPAAAKAWSTKDHREWLFVLDDNARWSNGHAVTAEDFVASWRRLAEPKNGSPLAAYLIYMQLENAKEIQEGKKPASELGVTALNETTLQLRLAKPNKRLIDMLAHVALLPSFQGEKPTSEQLVSNAAYRLEKRIENNGLRLQAVENTTNFATVDYYAVSPLQDAGQADIVENPQAEQQENILAFPRLCTYYYEFNFADAELKKKEVRQAIKSMILSAHIARPYGIANNSVLPKSMKITDEITENPIAVEQLLKQAGIHPENPLKLSLIYDNQGQHSAIAMQIIRTLGQSDLFKVTPLPLEWTQLLAQRQQKQFQLSRSGWCADHADPAQFLWHFHSQSPNNKSNYRNKSVDQQLEQLQNENLSEEQRRQLIQSIAKLIDDDAAILPLFQYQRKIAIASTVLGIDLNNDSEVIYSKHLYRMKPKD